MSPCAHPTVRHGPSTVPSHPTCAPGALSLSSALRAPAHPQPADTAWKSLPWFPWKLGAKNHFQGHVSHSNKANVVHTNPKEDPTPGRRELVPNQRGAERGQAMVGTRETLASETS